MLTHLFSVRLLLQENRFLYSLIPRRGLTVNFLVCTVKLSTSPIGIAQLRCDYSVWIGPKMSQEDRPPSPATTKKKGDKSGKGHLQNIVPLIDCWAVVDTPLDFSFMKLTTPAGTGSHVYLSMHLICSLYSVLCCTLWLLSSDNLELSSAIM